MYSDQFSFNQTQEKYRQILGRNETSAENLFDSPYHLFGQLSDDQLVNFLLLCHQYQYGVGEEQQGEMEEEEMIDHHDGDVKVKIMKVGEGDNIQEMMNKMLGG